MNQQIKKAIQIAAPPSSVWEALTNPHLMRQWMGEPEMEVEIIFEQKTGSPILIKGFHHVRFENRGTILQLRPHFLFQYNYLSPISGLPDKPENYTSVGFHLESMQSHTLLVLVLENFPTESIFRHVGFYWEGTLPILKRMVENQF